MVFSSVVFVFGFLPVSIAGYFLLPQCVKNWWLLAVSLIFYAWGEPRYVFLMLLSIGVNYLLGLSIDRVRSPAKRRFPLLAAIVYNIGILFFFKYANFVAGLIDSLLGSHLTDTAFFRPIALPIGISFFTFQILSYVIDVYRGQTDVQKNIGKLALYIALFPQLIAGPIVRYADIAAQIDRRTVCFDKIYTGALRFCRGFIKKVLFSNQVAAVAEFAFAGTAAEYYGDIPAIAAWAGIFAYALQIYFDFSGYSDMAIGLGKIFGFDFLENFDHPYISCSVREFWRRWHISLSTWFRDYVYIPLGGNRRGTKRTILNLYIVFFLTGLWHGASLNFVLWGLYHGTLLFLERTRLMAPLQRAPRWIQRAYATLAVLLGWVLFRADTLPAAAHYFSRMFCLEGWDLGYLFMQMNLEKAVFLLIAAALCTPVCTWAASKVRRMTGQLPCLLQAAGDTAMIVGFLWSLLYLVGNGMNPFIYFRF